MGVATVIPAGSVSVKATPVSAAAAFELPMVKFKLVVPFSGMLAAPKDLAMLGGAIAVRLAAAVFPVPPLTEETAPVVLL